MASAIESGACNDGGVAISDDCDATTQSAIPSTTQSAAPSAVNKKSGRSTAIPSKTTTISMTSETAPVDNNLTKTVISIPPINHTLSADELSKISSSHSHKITPLTLFQYTYSLALLVFCMVIVSSLIFDNGTQLSYRLSMGATSPTTASALTLVLLLVTLLLLSMAEGQQASLVGLIHVADHEVYRYSHPLTYQNTRVCYLGNNLERYLNGRQFMVLLGVFVINLCGGLSNRYADDTASAESSREEGGTLLNLPPVVLNIFLPTNLALILVTAMIGQLTTQVNASHCMIDFINNYFALFTLYAALVTEFSGVMHASYLIQYILSLVSGEPIQSREEPRTPLQASFFWIRVAISVALVGLSLAVTLVALFEGKTTMWGNVSPGVSLVLFFVLLCVVGMLEAMQIAFYAASKMKNEDLERSSSMNQSKETSERSMSLTSKIAHFFGRRTRNIISQPSRLPAFMIGRQLLVISCFFLLAKITTLNISPGQGENILGVSDGMQSFLNTGLHAALLTTILGSSSWKLASSAFPFLFLNSPFTYLLLHLGLLLEWTGICSGSWVLAKVLKWGMKLQIDEVYIGTPERPVLSQDALDQTNNTLDHDGNGKGIGRSRDEFEENELDEQYDGWMSTNGGRVGVGGSKDALDIINNPEEVPFHCDGVEGAIGRSQDALDVESGANNVEMGSSDTDQLYSTKSQTSKR